MQQVGKNVFLVLMSLLVIGLLGAPAWSASSVIEEPGCSTNITDPILIRGPSVFFDWTTDNTATRYRLLVGFAPGDDAYCTSGSTNATSYTCSTIPTTPNKYVFAQLQVTTVSGSYPVNCIYRTQ